LLLLLLESLDELALLPISFLVRSTEMMRPCSSVRCRFSMQRDASPEEDMVT